MCFCVHKKEGDIELLCVFKGMWVSEHGERYDGVVHCIVQGKDSSWRVGIVQVKRDRNLHGDDDIAGVVVASTAD